MSKRDNNAYRLDMFSSNAVPQRKNKKSRPELVKNTLTKKQQEAQHKQKQSYKTRVKVIFTALLFLGAMVVMVYSKVILNEKVAMLHGAERELNQLKSEHTRLNNEVENRYSDAYIIEYAEIKLGMVKISSQQINYINHETNDSVELGSDNEKGFIKKILSVFNSEEENSLNPPEIVAENETGVETKEDTGSTSDSFTEQTQQKIAETPEESSTDSLENEKENSEKENKEDGKTD